MNFFETLKSIYRKDKKGLPEKYDTQLGITLTKWLSFYYPNVTYLKNIIPYIFYLEPEHYFYLLYCSVPKKQEVPFVKKPPTSEEEKNPLLSKLQYILGWSDKDLIYNMPILKQTVLKNEEYWKIELGVK